MIDNNTLIVLKRISLATGIDRDVLGVIATKGLMLDAVTSQHRLNFRQYLYHSMNQGLSHYQPDEIWDLVSVTMITQQDVERGMQRELADNEKYMPSRFLFPEKTIEETIPNTPNSWVKSMFNKMKGLFT